MVFVCFMVKIETGKAWKIEDEDEDEHDHDAGTALSARQAVTHSAPKTQQST